MDEKKIIYVDMDDVLCAFTKKVNECLARVPDIKFPQSQYDFFRSLEPLEGAIEGLNFLRAQPHFDVYILTAPSVYNPLCYSEKRMWIEDHFDMALVNRLIISPNKGLNKGHYLIDDHETGRGQENFEGRLLHFGSPAFPDWQKVITYFQTTYLD